jgi:preprotein translocase subunit SecG
MNLIAEGASTTEIVLGALLFFISLAIIGIVLLQKEKGGGLSGAFGGAGSMATFGVKTSQVVEKFTWFLFIVFVCCTFIMAMTSTRDPNAEDPKKTVENSEDKNPKPEPKEESKEDPKPEETSPDDNKKPDGQ